MDVSWLGLLSRHGWRVLGAVTLSLLASSCVQSSAEEKATPAKGIEGLYREASLRLVTRFLEGGWVVSRNPDGTPEHQGEGLIWSGIAMAALPCDLGDKVETTLATMVATYDGALVRFEPLGEYAKGREVTLDGALGLYRGITERVVRCGKSDLWAPLVRLHLDFLATDGGRLHPNVDAKLIPHFDAVLDLLAHRLGVGSAPHMDSLRALGGELIGWAAAVNATHAAAYRVNLAMITIETLEALGYRFPDEQRWQFCAATRGIDIPTAEHWCGRESIREWVISYRFNEWEFRHQRSGSWESPDANGDETPGLDLLVGMRQGYSLP